MVMLLASPALPAHHAPPPPHTQECLDFASSAWCRLFCRLHGGELLLEALLLHSEALEQGQRQGAEPAELAALQALHSLVRCAHLARTCPCRPGWTRPGLSLRHLRARLAFQRVVPMRAGCAAADAAVG